MADTFYPLASMVKINDANLAPFEASNILNDSPLVRALASVYASNGTDHKVITETTEVTTGFRAVNDGRENSVSADTVVTLNCKILDASFAVDKALAESFTGGWQAFVAREASRHLRSAFFNAEKQVAYGTGTGGSAAGFAGLGDNAAYNQLADGQVVNAGGSSGCSSVWLLRTGEDAVALVLGNEGNIAMDETTVVRIAGTTGTYPAYYTPITAWMALQIPSTYDVARICNLDASSNSLTDDLIAAAIALFPVGRRPNLIAMNRRSWKQLQNSRTATTPTGAPAPFPSESHEVPIVVTDAILSTETALA
jgi:hypothetical protein